MKNKEELTKIVIAVLDGVLDLKEYPINADFNSDFGMDSIDEVDFVMGLEKALEISVSDDVLDNLHTIEQTVNYLLNAHHEE